MKKIYDNVLDLIGWTPLVRLNKVASEVNAEILVKIESCNPTCSIKDRIALYMVEDAERNGILKLGSVIVEPTTGNTGIALSLVAAVKGYRMVVVMPEFVSKERTFICQALGAEVVRTPKKEGIEGVIRKAKELVATTPHAFMLDQFTNPANPRAHRETTGREIIEQIMNNLFLAPGIMRG
jgi:cysteine synthase A